MTTILPIKSIRSEDLAGVAHSLKRGGLVCLPTDTVYGMACLPVIPGALNKLYEAKGRGYQKPVALIFAALPDVFDSLAAIPERIRKVMLTLLPGPVTVVVPAADHEKAALGMPEADGLGLRVMPPPLDKLYGHLPGPLAVTSANLSGGPDPCSVEEIPEGIRKTCDYVIDAGPCPRSIPSTVVDLRPMAGVGDHVIIREGAVPAAEVGRRIEGCGC